MPYSPRTPGVPLRSAPGYVLAGLSARPPGILPFLISICEICVICVKKKLREEKKSEKSEKSVGRKKKSVGRKKNLWEEKRINLYCKEKMITFAK